MLLNPETEIFYSNYEKLLTSAGICFLHNEHTSVQLKGNDFVFHGLELPVEYYHKPNSPALSLTAMEEMIGYTSNRDFMYYWHIIPNMEILIFPGELI